MSGPPRPPRPQRVYVAFEGGGAKGIVHVGALRALDRARDAGQIEIAGFAGTSAGAIVAALAAVGWRGDQLVDPDKPSNILQELINAQSDLKSAQAIELLGDGWTALKDIRAIFDLFDRLPKRPWLWVALAAATVFAGFALAAGGLAQATGSILAAFALTSALAAAIAMLLAGLGVFRKVGVVIRLLELDGLASLDGMEKRLEEALSLKVFDTIRGPEPVTFRILNRRGFPPLRVVAADMRNGALRLIPSTDADLDMPVARAVAASACIPGLFKPIEVDDGASHLVDGGLVSNLPAWAFDEELRLEDMSTVFALEIDAASGPDMPTLMQLVRTAIFGSGMLNTRDIPQLHVVKTLSGVKLLDFDMSYSTARDEMERGETNARTFLIDPVVIYEAAFTRLARKACEIFQNELNKSRVEMGLEPVEDFDLRCAILTPFGTPASGLRVRYSSGYDEAPDDRMSLPIRHSVSGEAFETGYAVYEEDVIPSERSIGQPQYEVLRKRTHIVEKGFIAAIRVDLGQKINGFEWDRCVFQIDGPYTLLDSAGLDAQKSRSLVSKVRDGVTRALVESLDGARVA